MSNTSENGWNTITNENFHTIKPGDLIKGLADWFVVGTMEPDGKKMIVCKGEGDILVITEGKFSSYKTKQVPRTKTIYVIWDSQRDKILSYYDEKEKASHSKEIFGDTGLVIKTFEVEERR